MKKIIFSILVMGNFSNATMMLKCTPTGMDSASKTVMQIQFSEGKDIGHPHNLQASIVDKTKTNILIFSNEQDETEGFFLVDGKTRRNYYLTRRSPKSAITASCTEPKAMGMMLPCSGDTEFKCKKVSGF